MVEDYDRSQILNRWHKGQSKLNFLGGNLEYSINFSWHDS